VRRSLGRQPQEGESKRIPKPREERRRIIARRKTAVVRRLLRVAELFDRHPSSSGRKRRRFWGRLPPFGETPRLFGEGPVLFGRGVVFLGRPLSPIGRGPVFFGSPLVFWGEASSFSGAPSSFWGEASSFLARDLPKWTLKFPGVAPLRPRRSGRGPLGCRSSLYRA